MDPEARDLYVRYADEVCRFASAVAGRGDAEDVAMDTLVRVLGSDRWRQARDVRSYLFRCVVNETRSRHRSSQRREARERSFVTAGGRDDNPQVRIDVLDAVGRLSPRQRAVIYLTYWLDTDTETAGSTLGVSVRTIERELGALTSDPGGVAAMIDLDSEIRRAMGELSEAAPAAPSVASFESMLEQPDRSSHRIVAGLAAAAVIVLGLGAVWASVSVRGNSTPPVGSGPAPASNDRDNNVDRSTPATLNALVAPALPAGFQVLYESTQPLGVAAFDARGVEILILVDPAPANTLDVDPDFQAATQTAAGDTVVGMVRFASTSGNEFHATDGVVGDLSAIVDAVAIGLVGDRRQAILERDETRIDTRSLFNDVNVAMHASLGELGDGVDGVGIDTFGDGLLRFSYTMGDGSVEVSLVHTDVRLPDHTVGVEPSATITTRWRNGWQIIVTTINPDNDDPALTSDRIGDIVDEISAVVDVWVDTPIPNTCGLHDVDAVETLASIAHSLNVSVDELAALNHTDTVSPGDQLLVPCPPAPDNATAD